jgi:hypothetical protein
MYHGGEANHRMKDCPIFLKTKRKWIKSWLSLHNNQRQESQPHNAVDSTPPAILTILPFAISTTDMPK